jgi:hypothetical protein
LQAAERQQGGLIACFSKWEGFDYAEEHAIQYLIFLPIQHLQAAERQQGGLIACFSKWEGFDYAEDGLYFSDTLADDLVDDSVYDLLRWSRTCLM